ncbi:MAG: flagellar motor protein MotB [Lachnospiraceae bacterium]|nr:flagellar motor protein MotB [Lachnospiraceae bacterium]
MAKKPKQEDAPKGSPAWMATFSDLMNLLLCFFVLLFSMSSVDAAKYEMVAASLSAAFSIFTPSGATIVDGQLVGSGVSQLPDIANFFGDSLSEGEGAEGGESTPSGETSMNNNGGATTDTQMESTGEVQTANNGGQSTTGANQGSESQDGTESGVTSEQEAEELLEQKALSESEKMAQKVQEQASAYGIQDQIEVDFNGQYVRITLSGALLFDSAEATLRGEAVPLVERIGKILNNYSDNLIEVEGHADNVPISSSKYESNDVLSMYRALNVANQLREVTDIDPAHIYSSGRGDYEPIADNSTAEGRARNRRVEIKIYNSYNSDSLE